MHTKNKTTSESFSNVGSHLLKGDKFLNISTFIKPSHNHLLYKNYNSILLLLTDIRMQILYRLS